MGSRSKNWGKTGFKRGRGWEEQHEGFDGLGRFSPKSLDVGEITQLNKRKVDRVPWCPGKEGLESHVSGVKEHKKTPEVPGTNQTSIALMVEEEKPVGEWQDEA